MKHFIIAVMALLMAAGAQAAQWSVIPVMPANFTPDTITQGEEIPIHVYLKNLGTETVTYLEEKDLYKTPLMTDFRAWNDAKKQTITIAPGDSVLTSYSIGNSKNLAPGLNTFQSSIVTVNGHANSTPTTSVTWQIVILPNANPLSLYPTMSQLNYTVKKGQTCMPKINLVNPSSTEVTSFTELTLFKAPGADKFSTWNNTNRGFKVPGCNTVAWDGLTVNTASLNLGEYTFKTSFSMVNGVNNPKADVVVEWTLTVEAPGSASIKAAGPDTVKVSQPLEGTTSALVPYTYDIINEGTTPITSLHFSEQIMKPGETQWTVWNTYILPISIDPGQTVTYTGLKINYAKFVPGTYGIRMFLKDVNGEANAAQGADAYADFVLKITEPTTGIADQEWNAQGGETRYYDLQGRPVLNPTNGLYIRLQGGKATKILR